MIHPASPDADMCLILEGAYPYVAGGVSTWMHELIKAQRGLTFHLVALCADATPNAMRFELPENVIGMTVIALQQEEHVISNGNEIDRLVGELEEPLQRLLAAGDLDDFRAVIRVLRRFPGATRAALLNSQAAFELIERMYARSVPGSSFLNYFWSWRSLLGGLFSVLLVRLPRARVYHAISTGYAGLVLARAVTETGRPGLLTEHGIYTNERRIELMMADWLTDGAPVTLDIEGRRRDLRDVWIDAFCAYSRICYQACSRIVTLYKGNQTLQQRDGAPPDRLTIIPNGVDVEAFSRLPVDEAPRRPTVALIGRVVPIKDVKTYIRSVALLRDMVPGVRALLLGPTDEDPCYMAECEDMVAHLGLRDTFEFLGRVKLDEHLGRIDAIVLTSISEAQPLVLLEAGAAGVPSVATDVGSCSEIILGRSDENPKLGAGGFIVPPADPAATSRALARLLGDAALRNCCGEAIQRRAQRYYNKPVVDRVYAELYAEYLAAPTLETR